MKEGRFYAGIAALIWSPNDKKYLLLKRSSEKDFASGAWECVTGRVDQGESFEEAVHREVYEELRVEVNIDFIVGTTHFYRGEKISENELVGVVYACSLENTPRFSVSHEHSDFMWVTLEEACKLLITPDPSTMWITQVIHRAETIRNLLPEHLIQFNHKNGFELG